MIIIEVLFLFSILIIKFEISLINCCFCLFVGLLFFGMSLILINGMLFFKIEIVYYNIFI